MSPCSSWCYCCTASGSGPAPRVSGSCHSRDCAGDTRAAGSDWAGGRGRETLCPQVPPTMRCLYSSDASCTAVSHALGPLAYTCAGSNFQNLKGKGNVLGTGSAPLWSSSFMNDFCAGCPRLWGQPGPCLVWCAYFLPIETLSSRRELLETWKIRKSSLFASPQEVKQLSPGKTTSATMAPGDSA